MVLSIRPQTDHPAKFSAEVIEAIQVEIDRLHRRLHRRPRVLDPMAGVGRIHDLARCETTGVELEPEWAACRAGTIIGDATSLPAEWTGRFDAVCVSPVYGNRMSDHHDARDSHKPCDGAGCRECAFTGLSPRKTYKGSLGRDPTRGSACVLAWGPAYRNLHRLAVAEMVRVVAVGGLVVVNMSDHVRDKKAIPVTEWWRWTMEDAGIRVLAVRTIETKRMRHGANFAARADGEKLIVGRVQ